MEPEDAESLRQRALALRALGLEPPGQHQLRFNIYIYIYMSFTELRTTLSCHSRLEFGNLILDITEDIEAA